ncbi:hypothetical protein [Sedimentitalea arenosa]|uniref:Uncharacterized protein n=1 Tax=Sedimentitalea arenosa TaxID=2798803 RepID=A0A8J7J893_9RHOB|nr:hypothetical protein [Arenibacterium arenosum]MBJ6373055.1 hypothetical protein [Arenibacterium arenosum]
MSGPETASEKPDAPRASTPLGIFDKPALPAVTGIEIAAIALTVIWLVGSLIFFALLPEENSDGFDSLRFLMTMLTIFMPVGMIWVAAIAARSNRVMREESQRLQTAIDGIRQAYVAQAQRGAAAPDQALSRKLDEIAAAARKTETALATFSSRRDAPPTPATRPKPSPPPATTDQGSLALGTPAEVLSPPLPTEDFIRALNFPETAEDRDGFAAMRRAMRDRKTGQLIQASQDVLTLLSQDGIYVDDLRPDLARPETWRLFAQGARGQQIAALGGVRDRSSLALTAGRMKQDPIFRDAAHHFLRLFDRSFAEFEADATDADIAALANTRTARAFMLLGRVTGTFD